MSAVEPGGVTGRWGMAPGTGLVLGILLGVAALAVFLRTWAGAAPLGPEDVHITVPDWRATATEQAAFRALSSARHGALPRDEDANVKGLLAAYDAFNAADVRFGSDPRSRALADAKADYEQWALTALSFLGADAYMGLGDRVAQSYLAALDQGDLEAQERWGGTFVMQARRAGLVDGAGTLTSGAGDVIRALFLFRWAHAARERRPVDSLLAREELILLLRWKLAANPLARAHRRRKIAEELARLGSPYGAREALAARAADEGLWPEAARIYGELAAQSPGDRRLRANLAYAEARSQPRRRGPRP